MEFARLFCLLTCLMAFAGCTPAQVSNEIYGDLSGLRSARFALNPQQGTAIFVDGMKRVPAGVAVKQVLEELQGKGYRVQSDEDHADLWVGVYTFISDSPKGKGELVVEIQEKATRRRIWLGWMVLSPLAAERGSGPFPVRKDDVTALLKSLPSSMEHLVPS